MTKVRLARALAIVVVAMTLTAPPSGAAPPPPVARMSILELRHWIRRFCTPADHYYYKRKPRLVRGRLRDALVRLSAPTPLLDFRGKPVYRDDPKKPLVVAPGVYAVERHSTLQLAGEKDVLVYIWSAGTNDGHWLEGGVKTKDRFSGFIRLSAVSKHVNKNFLLRRPSTSNRIFGKHVPSILRKLGARKVRIEPHRTTGTYGPSRIGKFSDYGWAHDRLKNFCYGLIDLPIRGHIGGVSTMLLPRGQKVHATGVAYEWRANGRPNRRDHTFVLCFVELPARPGSTLREAVATWVCLKNLPSVRLADVTVVKPW